MNRREFLKNTATMAALGAVVHTAARAGILPDGDGKWRAPAQGPQVTRRPFKGADFSLPLLGFGLMRLPEKDGKVDRPLARTMMEMALAAGANYFDTAYMYHGGESEMVVGEVLSKIPRDRYFLTSKMPIVMLKEASDVPRYFEEQLARTKAGYFDFYFMHWLNGPHWELAQRLKVREFMERMQAEGKIRRLGFSFHGEPETLRKIATACPWDLVQIQLNYLDWDLCRSGEQYGVLTELGIPVAIMEPLKGGTLVKLSPDARAVFKKANPAATPASWGLRYAASLPNVSVVLSGMSTPEQMAENLQTFSPLVPLNENERETIAVALAAYRQAGAIPCTTCRYCAPCPVGVDIPRNLALHNQVKGGLELFHAKLVYDAMEPAKRASSCIGCRQCLHKCPQQLPIPALMKEIAGEFA